MVAKIKMEDLPEEVLAKLGLSQDGNHALNNRMIVMAIVIRAISGQTSRDALWLLRHIIKLVEGARDKRSSDKRAEPEKGESK